MSNSAKNRKKAVEFEQAKQFDRAIASYMRAIEDSEAESGEVDVALFNKVGDLTLRQGRVADAVVYYERAVEHYVTAGLYNNAIALCNKILRSSPGRSQVYFSLGRICARKGLRGDATRNFLEYASRMQQEGRVDEGMRALAEVADLMPELTEVRRLVEEHAARVGIALPQRKVATPSSVSAQPDAAKSNGANGPKDLVFLDIDYGTPIVSRSITPPIVSPVTQSTAPAAARASVPPSMQPISRQTNTATSDKKTATTVSKPTPSKLDSARSARLEDLFIFDPTSPDAAAAIDDSDESFVDGASLIMPPPTSADAPASLSGLEPTTIEDPVVVEEEEQAQQALPEIAAGSLRETPNLMIAFEPVEEQGFESVLGETLQEVERRAEFTVVEPTPGLVTAMDYMIPEPASVEGVETIEQALGVADENEHAETENSDVVDATVSETVESDSIEIADAQLMESDVVLSEIADETAVQLDVDVVDDVAAEVTVLVVEAPVEVAPDLHVESIESLSDDTAIDAVATSDIVETTDVVGAIEVTETIDDEVAIGIADATEVSDATDTNDASDTIVATDLVEMRDDGIAAENVDTSSDVHAIEDVDAHVDVVAIELIETVYVANEIESTDTIDSVIAIDSEDTHDETALESDVLWLESTPAPSVAPVYEVEHIVETEIEIEVAGKTESEFEFEPDSDIDVAIGNAAEVAVVEHEIDEPAIVSAPSSAIEFLHIDYDQPTERIESRDTVARESHATNSAEHAVDDAIEEIVVLDAAVQSNGSGDHAAAPAPSELPWLSSDDLSDEQGASIGISMLEGLTVEEEIETSLPFIEAAPVPAEIAADGLIVDDSTESIDEFSNDDAFALEGFVSEDAGDGCDEMAVVARLTPAFSSIAHPVRIESEHRPSHALRHDFILPGELPALVLPDHCVTAAVETRANVLAHASLAPAQELQTLQQDSHADFDAYSSTECDATSSDDAINAIAAAHDALSQINVGNVDGEFDDLDDLFGSSTVHASVAAAEANVVAASRRDELRAAAAAEPRNWTLRRRLAEALFEAGEREDALRELQASLAGFEQQGDLLTASEIADELVRVDADRPVYHQKRVQLAVRLQDDNRLRDAYLDLADALVRGGDEAPARAVYVRVLEIDPWDDRARTALGDAAPPAPPRPTDKQPDDDYVDLAGWLQDDDEPASTRMRMREPTVTGNEQDDFESLLRHFKEGVSRSLGEEDYESHYDLGVAYKEMGLLDDAVAEFQKALRSKSHRLPAYEALGQCFLEQESYQVAATVLSRALHEPGLGDEQRVGVLYLLGYACEALHRFGEARSYFERVYATDIHFRDVANRLATLDQIAR